jgi:alpha-methylacyl-CoA racemase
MPWNGVAFGAAADRHATTANLLVGWGYRVVSHDWSEFGAEMSGPLAGVKVLEVAGIGPGPFAAMVLADMGAEVVRIDRADAVESYDLKRDANAALHRGRRSIAVDLKSQEGISTVLRMTKSADALIEGFRPGVMERLGLGPDVVLGKNPAIVYGRMTGWGQDGPYAQMAGHDINYIALAGVLNHIGRAGHPPTPPLNLVGDFGGGGMMMAFGVVCALFEARQSGCGQVIDAAMFEAASLLATVFYNSKLAVGERGTNMLDSGAPFYNAYETSDGRYVAVGAVEPQFYAQLLRLVGLDPTAFQQWDRSTWPSLKIRLATVFASKSRDDWCKVMEDTDACFAPVLSFTEATSHHHGHSRGSFVEIDGSLHPGPVPRFSRTQPEIPTPPACPGQHTDEVLLQWGFTEEEVLGLRASGSVA